MKSERRTQNDGGDQPARKIKITPDGPYIVYGGLPLGTDIIVSNRFGWGMRWEKGSDYPFRETYALCRCGRSKHFPYCDNSHRVNGFNGAETASREPYRRQAETIEGPALRLTDLKALCSSSRFCNRSGGTWNLTRRSDNPKFRAVAVTEAGECPSGRLTAWDKETDEPIEPALTPSIGLVADPFTDTIGPFWVKGGVPIESADGTTYEIRNRVTLCCCGGSYNKPFCDGRHISLKFNRRDEEREAEGKKAQGRGPETDEQESGRRRSALPRVTPTAEITPINLGFVNCFIVKTAAGFFLIDTGTAVHRARVERALMQAGCRPGDLKLIILTHGDIDHIGNAAYLRKAFRTKIALHRADEPAVADFSGCRAAVLRKARRGTLSAQGFKAMAFLLNLPPVRRRMESILFSPDLFLADGDELDRYGLPGRVLHLPGHTPGSIGILLSSGDVFVGDLVRSTRRSILPFFGEDAASMAVQLERLLLMRVATVYPGHGRMLKASEIKR